MGYLIHILLALVVQGLVELSGTAWREWPLAVVLLALVPHALGRAALRAFLAGRFRIGGLLQALTTWSPLVLQLAAQWLCGWNRSLERWTGARPVLLDWPHPTVLLALTPFAVYTLASIDARALLYGPVQRGAVRRFHTRMFVTGLLPLAAFVSSTWAIGLEPRLRINLEEVGLYAGFLALVLLTLFVVCLPWVVKHVWETRPLPRGYQRELVESIAREVELRCSEILVWGTGQQMSNAAVVGIGPRRVVLLSDALLAELPPRELAAVFAHEAAHVKCHHVLIFLAWSVALFIGADLMTVWAEIESELWATLAVAGAFLLWYLAFGWLSRRFELEADLWSAETTGDPAALASALERVGSIHGRRTGWRHFGTDERVAFLQRTALDHQVGERLRTTLRRTARLGLLALVVAVGLELWMLLDQLDGERLRVDLRLGNYVSAQERLSRSEEPDPDLQRGLRLVLALPAPRTVEGLLRAAAEALERGDSDAARDLTELASIRGAAVPP